MLHTQQGRKVADDFLNSGRLPQADTCTARNIPHSQPNKSLKAPNDRARTFPKRNVLAILSLYIGESRIAAEEDTGAIIG